MSKSRVSQTLIMLGDEADDIVLHTDGGLLTIGLGLAAAINLAGSGEDALAKLVDVAQQALVVARLRTMRAVA